MHHRLGVLPARPYQALTYPAMAIALVVGLAMALTTVPTQTIVFERAAPEVRGRVLAMQQLLGGAVPLVPLLIIGPLSDALGVSAVLVLMGCAILAAAWCGTRGTRAAPGVAVAGAPAGRLGTAGGLSQAYFSHT